MQFKNSKTLLLLTLLGLLSGCSEHPNRLPSNSNDVTEQISKIHVHIISRDLSRFIGEGSYQAEIANLANQEKIEENPRVVKKIQAITSRLVQQATEAFPYSRDWDWEIYIVKNDEPNATCGPGGKMVIHTGMLALTEFNEHKLATVLGHEIAHALLEHSRSSIGRDAIAMGTLQAMGQSFKMGMLRLNSLISSMQTVTLPMDRDHEREADVLGMQLMAKAGFNPVVGASIWSDMVSEDSNSALIKRLEPYISSHPTSLERQNTLTQFARQLTSARP